MNEETRQLIISIYNKGYTAGHNETKSGQYKDIPFDDLYKRHEGIIDIIIGQFLKASNN